jgi:uncharacterized BrkB/YihY/UPF0761 family membrane protein
MGAAPAFFGGFSLAPLLAIVIAGAGALFGIGTLVVLLLWPYCSAQLFLLGAQFTHHHHAAARRAGPRNRAYPGSAEGLSPCGSS